MVMFATAASSEQAKQLATALATTKLAACVNLIPGIQSVYEWEGRLEQSEEVILMIKVRRPPRPRSDCADD